MRKRLAYFLLPLLVLFLAACDDPSVNRAATLQGVITDASGATITGATLTLVREDATTAASTTTSGADGAYTLGNLSAGAYNLTATTPSLGAYRTGITLAAQQTATADLTLAPLGNVIGTAVLEDRPGDSEGITLRLRGTTFTATTPANGNFTISGVPAGTYTLTASNAGYATNTTTVTVESGIGTVLPATLALASAYPTARFTATVDGPRVTLDASSSTDNDGTITKYAWDFGDGTTATGQQAEHTYTSNGTKTITLTVTDNDDLTDTSTQQANINVPAVATITDPNTHVGHYDIPAGDTHYVQVDTAGGASGLLYLELTRNLKLEAHTSSGTYYSVDGERFSTFPLLPGPASLKPQAIGLSTACRGSCVILPANSHPGVMLSITNHTASATSTLLYAFTEAPADENEPNDSFATATPLTDDDTGAIELIGDQDYYVIQKSGILGFQRPSDLPLRAHVHRANGERRATLQPDYDTAVSVGEYVVVEALGGEAAASAVSIYHLRIR